MPERICCSVHPWRRAEEKKLKLKSPNFVVSDTRLSVRNVPHVWTEKQLKQAFIAAVRGKGGNGGLCRCRGEGLAACKDPGAGCKVAVQGSAAAVPACYRGALGVTATAACPLPPRRSRSAPSRRSLW